MFDRVCALFGETIRTMLYALYGRVSCFVVRGCSVSKRYIKVDNCDMVSVVI